MAAVQMLPGAVKKYAENLRAVLHRDADRARHLLGQLLGDIILRPDKQGLVAELRSNLAVLLEEFDSRSNGAGRGI